MDSALTSMVESVGVGIGQSVEDVLLLHHRRMGHSSFCLLSRLYPFLYEKADKQKLVCDTCEFGKLTRSSYVSSVNRSSSIFDLIYSDIWGPCSISFMQCYRYFVSFIDYFSRVTWLYLMRNKSDILNCFKDFSQGYSDSIRGSSEGIEV
jgi:GAG-pre-integrase domain